MDINEWKRNRYKSRRQLMIEKLGGKCKKCGSVDNLEFDHIDPEKKEYGIEELLRGNIKKLLKEIKKCQLLCNECHKDKHSVAVGTHGTLSSYRHCRCDECRAAKASYMKKYHLKRKQQDN